MQIQITPKGIFEEYAAGQNYKAALGARGLAEQVKMNERFYIGDQWYGARCGSDRPLVRYNVIKRIGDFKIALVSNGGISVNYSADGVPNTLDTKEKALKYRADLALGTGRQFGSLLPNNEEVSVVMSALSDYYRVTAERLRFESIKESALRNAYISGTGVVYTYWDDTVRTGLYADAGRTKAIKGDIACEVIDIENVFFGDPCEEDIQKQPYILLAQEQSVAQVKREALRYGRPAAEIAQIQAQGGFGALQDDDKVTVLTKLWKDWNDSGTEYVIKAVRVCNGATVRSVWELGVRLYPLAKFCWDCRRNCAYGESEITYLIPNQIAINRMVTAGVWSTMLTGMPLMVVNGDVVGGPITNEPGQIVTVTGAAEDTAGAIRYITPPDFSANFEGNINSLVTNTLFQAGANDAALGNVSPDNTSAIIAVREAATLPLTTVQNRYYLFCEDIARIWAEFWVTQYGARSLKIEDENGTWYMPFDGGRYRDLIIGAKVDVGGANLWSETQSVQTLDRLLDKQVIDVLQYLQRLPKGAVQDVTGLIKEIKQKNLNEQEAVQ